ncbi:Hsp70 family protein [Vibrio methylphosphonaticus]|uniref:Hsp70 family protein n=1 Tax=Vibrio methylphosphonaticus TaxID=2946866 RepID=UPI00202ABC03|nr:Hsp70 family protein [Vibrio methylphosphonaticus]MCL9777275.1 Hsp70 family protein [Vibrio methylphosphonaticus]
MYIGIDLGTTFSLVAYVNPQGGPALFHDFHEVDEYRTPSCVHIGEAGVLVGGALEELLDDEPEITQARFFKLALGQSQVVYHDELGRDWSPQGLSALVLKKLLKDVQAATPEPIEGALIAVPANFTDSQRKATKEAAKLAGLKHVKLVEEPVAAATFYGYQQQGDNTYFVYDLGGGTFDATVLQVGDDGLYTLAAQGSNTHGGKHIDDIIIAYVMDEFERRYGQCELDAANQTKLRRYAQEVKVKLSKPGKSHLSKTLVIAGQTLDFVLTQDKFNQLLEQFVEQTLEVCERCLQAAGMDWSFIDTLLLTGGSSLLPLVKDRVAIAAGRSPNDLVCRQPHQAVAYGAALLAEQVFTTSPVKSKTLQGVCSYNLGFRAIGSDGKPKVKVLIDQNSPVPALASHTFYTNRDDQTRMVLEVVQQQDDKEPISLGVSSFLIENPKKHHGIEVTLGYDLEGLVTISAKDPATQKVIEHVLGEESLALNAQLLQEQQWLEQIEVNV